jgi:hypothetical protein
VRRRRRRRRRKLLLLFFFFFCVVPSFVELQKSTRQSRRKRFTDATNCHRNEEFSRRRRLATVDDTEPLMMRDRDQLRNP